MKKISSCFWAADYQGLYFSEEDSNLQIFNNTMPGRSGIKKAKTVTQLIIEPHTSENVKKLVLSALENELGIIKFGINKTLNQLKRFENKFGTESSAFYKKFNAGDMGDDFEYIRWAGEYETLHKLQQDYNDIASIRLC